MPKYWFFQPFLRISWEISGSEEISLRAPTWGLSEQSKQAK